MVFTFYSRLVIEHPIQSAMGQFAILGTLGEVLAASIKSRQFKLPCTGRQLFLKAVAWSVLGIIIKYGFTGMKGFTQALLDKSFLPEVFGQGVPKAFAVSTLTNLFFGPQMMAFHRLEDNLILGQKGYGGIQRAWWTLIWFWIPAHTLTFSLPQEYQIGLAALWGLVLGVILGLAKPGK